MDFNIDTLARLAKLELSLDEKTKLSGDLANILKYVEQINEVPLQGIAPTSHALDLENVFREDVVREQPQVADQVLAALPEKNKDGRFFKVPKVVDREA